MTTIDWQFTALPIPAGVEMESQSGLQLKNPKVYGVHVRAPGNRVAAILMHPSSNFMGHYLLEPLARSGIDALGLNTRFVNNDSTLIMERAILDLGAGVKHLRSLGYEKIFLVGNSGGGGLVSFYQSQAEKLTVTHTPAGDAITILPSDIPAADGIILVAAHLGRPQLLQGLIDPSILSESDPLSADPSLDMYAPHHGPPYDTDFIDLYRKAQSERMLRITDWARKRLHFVRESGIANDEAFMVYRTYADPRYLDLTLDANDRASGGDRGTNARKSNYGPNTLARFSTLTSWLSQWSPDSHALGPANLAVTSIPILQLEYTADASVFPNAVQQWIRAGGSRIENVPVKGATHYLFQQPELLAHVVSTIAEWSRR